MTEQAKTDGTKVAVLGIGVMGAPIARNLLRASFDVTVWNRTKEKAEALAAQGAYVASSPAEAASDVEFLITMLTDGAAVEAAMTGPEGALTALPPDAVWIQMSTVGVAATQRLAKLAVQRVGFVDAPVSGSSEPAERGELLILASGSPALRPRVRPLFDALGHRALWLNRLGDGNRFKLVLNNWLAVLTEGMAETIGLAESLGLDPDLLLDTLAESPLGSAYAIAKGHAMVQRDFTPGFPLHHAGKDAALALDAAHGHGIDLPLTEALSKRWDKAIVLGHANDDVAAAITTAR
ncbi:NAD(P)-dependent oxidoreductase [Kitasatospora sp. NPDC087861]|uniref:NAD(P)-dependent oxidoreductase n=1 Tax=Kitasatospora sp. NPDC087861 TaxID=3364070 RepID=UPI003811D9A7